MKLKNVLLFGLIFLFITSCVMKENHIIKLGAILCLTGSGSVYGEDAKRGIELAVDQINETSGVSGKKIKVVFEDDETKPKNSVNAINKLIETDKVMLVVGAITSSSTLAAAKIAEKSKIVLFSPGASSPLITDAGDYIFRNWISDTYEASKIAEYAFNELKLKNIVILYINNDYGNGLQNEFKKRFEQLGGNIVIDDSYEQGNTNFRPLLSKIKKTSFDAIYLPGYYNEIANILNQTKDLGINKKILSCVSFEDPEVIKIAGKNAEGVIYATPYYNPEITDPLTVAFVEAFKVKYNRIPGIFAAHSYDAIYIIKKAIESSIDKEGIKEALYGIKNFPGVTGLTSFDTNGDVVKPVSIKKVKNGQFIFIEG